MCMGTVSCCFKSYSLGKSTSSGWVTIPLYFSIQAFCSQAMTNIPSFCFHDDHQAIARVAGEVSTASAVPSVWCYECACLLHLNTFSMVFIALCFLQTFMSPFSYEYVISQFRGDLVMKVPGVLVPQLLGEVTFSWAE